jgi:hypothetical protein
MIVEKQYRVQLLDGKEITTLYETRQEAVRAHRGNINKLIEVSIFILDFSYCPSDFNVTARLQ